MRTLILFCLLIILSTLLFSCSGSTNPVSLEDSQEVNAYATAKIPYPDRGVFGAWKIRIDPQTLTAEIIPARNARAIGNIFDSDLSQFLTVAPCETCLRITHVQFNMDYYAPVSLLVDFAMKHPFGNSTTRPDLHGFDVRLILVCDSSPDDFSGLSIINPDGTEEDIEFENEVLLNADGYTSHYDWLPTDTRYFMGGEDVPANINPYLRYFDDYGTDPFDPQAPAGHNVMPVGSLEETRRAVISGQRFYGEGMDLYAIADVAYGQSAIFLNRTDPQYYLPAFNRTEAWRTEYWIENNNLNEGDPTSTAEVVVQVFDWQHSATVDPGYPNPANLSGIPESSRVANLQLLVPSLMGDDVVEASVPESGDGSPTNPLQYRLTVINQNTSSFNSFGILAVRDELQGQASPHGRVPIPEQPAGFPYDTLDIRDYTHYNIIRINIPYTTSYPFPFNQELIFDSRELYSESGFINTKITHFMDPTGMKFLYEWDYDYDGVTFDVDYDDSCDVFFGSPDVGIHYIGLRVSTNSVPPRQYVYRIPVYIKGENFNRMLSPSEQIDTTYQGQSNAMDIHEDSFYTAYTYHGPGQQDIFIARCDSEGWQQSTNVTSIYDGVCYNPCLEIIDDGPNAGIYVGFTIWDSGEPDVLSTYGDFDLSGFVPANVVPISNDPAATENEVNLFHHDGTLYAYYVRNDAVEQNNIMCASQTPGAMTWTIEGVVANPPAGEQSLPSISYSSSEARLYLVWQDGRDFGTRAHDIYMSSSDNFTVFTDGVNLFPETGLFEEATPSVSAARSQVAVTFLTNNLVTADINAWILLTDQYVSSRTVMELGTTSTQLKSIPAVSWIDDNRLITAYALYDSGSQELTAKISEIYRLKDGWDTIETVLYTKSAGMIPAGAAFIFPGIATRYCNEGFATENLVCYRTFENGHTDGTDPAMAYGNIQFIDYILQGDY
jgi:hypothetical protein